MQNAQIHIYKHMHTQATRHDKMSTKVINQRLSCHRSNLKYSPLYSASLCHTQTNNVSQSFRSTENRRTRKRRQDWLCWLMATWDMARCQLGTHILSLTQTQDSRRETHTQTHTHRKPLRLNLSHQNWQADVKWEIGEHPGTKQREKKKT